MIQEEIDRIDFEKERMQQKVKAVLDTTEILKWFTPTELESMIEVIKDNLNVK